mmetsp:Transcript_8172/g.9661  ORF Transcript_8172/g.9661 Transcript_8172/m.9661 type:complete len:195 (+) Transcript_8172:2-586(+)
MHKMVELALLTQNPWKLSGKFANTIVNQFSSDWLLRIMRIHAHQGVDYFAPRLYRDLDRLNTNDDARLTRSFLIPPVDHFDPFRPVGQIVFDNNWICVESYRDDLILGEKLLGIHWDALQASKLQAAVRVVLSLHILRLQGYLWIQFQPKLSSTVSKCMVLLALVSVRTPGPFFVVDFQDNSENYRHLLETPLY